MERHRECYKTNLLFRYINWIQAIFARKLNGIWIVYFVLIAFLYGGGACCVNDEESKCVCDNGKKSLYINHHPIFGIFGCVEEKKILNLVDIWTKRAHTIARLVSFSLLYRLCVKLLVENIYFFVCVIFHKLNDLLHIQLGLAYIHFCCPFIM